MNSKSITRLVNALDSHPRESLGHLPTPLEPMHRLTERTGGAVMWVKRDDCTGLGLGGNKIRQLEFYFGDARAKGADTVLITGAVQSNYVRCCAAAAARLGMHCHIQLEHRVNKDDYAYTNSGNVILDRLFGATLYSFPEGEDEAGADAELDRIAAELAVKGARPYVVHLGSDHPPVGAMGYAAAAAELLGQFDALELEVDEIVVASGSSHTHAGLLTGLRLAGSGITVTGVCVRREAELQRPRVLSVCRQVESLLGCNGVVHESDVAVMDDVYYPGYGLLNDDTAEAIRLGGRCEGLILDPVYTAKSMAGCLQRARLLGEKQTIVYIHTGGIPGFFAYEKDITPLLALAE